MGIDDPCVAMKGIDVQAWERTPSARRPEMTQTYTPGGWWARGNPTPMATDLDEMLAFTEALLREPPAPPRPPRSLPHRAAAARQRAIPAPTRPAPVRRPPRPPGRRPSPAVVLGLVLVLVGLPPVAPLMRLRVGGQLLVFHSRAVNVATALEKAGIEPVDGVLLSAVTHRVIDKHFDRATVRRRGRAVAIDATARTGDVFTIRQGHPVVEASEHRAFTIAGGGLPAIEYQLWNAARAGVTDRLVGVRSGETVSETVASPPVAASPTTDAAVALTFDDGPNPEWTPAVLAVLRNAGIKATFCIVGYAAKRYPQLVKAIKDEGHTLCNHTMDHVQLLGRKPADVVVAQLKDGSAAIEKAAGVAPKFFRAPGGTWADNLIAEVHHQGMRALGWNVDPADYKRPGAAVITDTIFGQLRPGAVILMHDGGGDRSQTVAQLPVLIDRLKAMGYSFRVPT
jgi:peptidoglycan/xylan/chitin deacetylase (PgdA/CDA1 family)